MGKLALLLLVALFGLNLWVSVQAQRRPMRSADGVKLEKVDVDGTCVIVGYNPENYGIALAPCR